MIIRQACRLISRRIPQLASVSVRHHNFDGEAYSETNMSMVTREDESHIYLASFSNYGFQLTNGFSILGPCALFPRAVLHWHVKSSDKITPESLSLFCMLEPKLDVLIIGKGDWDCQIDKDIIKYLRSKRINVEILPTEQACSTFNFLNSERRVVAAAMIPPLNVDAPQDLFIDSYDMLELHDKKLDDFGPPKVEEIMTSFKDRGISETVGKYGRPGKRKKPPQDLESPDDEETKKIEDSKDKEDPKR